MNLVKASSVLYPILGENVSDIILRYMIYDEPIIAIEKPNMYRFFVDNDLCTDRIKELYDSLKTAYDSPGDCYRAYIEHRDCKMHKDCDEENDLDPEYELDLRDIIFNSSKTPKWMIFTDESINSILTDISNGVLTDELREVFLLDLKLEHNQLEI